MRVHTHKHRYAVWTAIAILLQFLDLITFIPAVYIWGISGESNFVMTWVYDLFGEPGVYCAKLLAIGLFLLAADRLGDIESRLAPLALALIGTIGLLGAATNLLAIWIAG